MEFVGLELIAELGVALAGFAALAGAIRGSVYDAEAIFGVVANGATAATFALLALRFAETPESIRLLAAAMTFVAFFVALRGLQIFVVTSREQSIERDHVSGVLAALILLGLVAVPVIVGLAAFAIFPSKLAVLYESALICALVTALLLLLIVVWRHFAVRRAPAPAAQQAHEADPE